MPKVSVIVPCYNLGKYLPDALESVLHQTFPDWECIVINDGSVDETAAVAGRFCQQDRRFSLINQKNAGVSNARNIGIRHSHGVYILPLDADDVIAADYLEKAVGVLDSDDNADIVYGRAMWFKESLASAKPLPLPDFTIERMLARNCIYVSALFRRVDYDKTLGYNPDMGGGYEDWDFWLDMIKNGAAHIVRLDSVVFYYRVRHGSRNDVDNVQLTVLRKKLWEHHKVLYGSWFFDPKESVEYRRLLSTLNKPLVKIAYRMRMGFVAIINRMMRIKK